MKIGFLGLGNMGESIAANLLRATHEVAVWNRTPAKAQPLIEAGAGLATSPKDAAAGRDVVFTMLADDAALDSVLAGENGLLAGLAPGALHISLSTIAVATAERIAATHRAAGQRFLCAPVFGRPAAAKAAKLFVVAAGVAADFEAASPLLGVISQRVFYLGDRASAAALVKLCGNFMILSAIEALGEAMTLAEKGGVAKQQLLEILTGTLFDTPLYRTYGAILAEDRFRPAGFAAPLGLKDMRLVGQSAEALRVPMPLLSVLRDHLLQAIAQEGEEVDWSAIAMAIKRNAAMP
jgi:3-hydroxyisobutyrate dehydrogenase-like beta-hydroxyacid dehydrogenase